MDLCCLGRSGGAVIIKLVSRALNLRSVKRGHAPWRRLGTWSGALPTLPLKEK